MNKDQILNQQNSVELEFYKRKVYKLAVTVIYWSELEDDGLNKQKQKINRKSRPNEKYDNQDKLGGDANSEKNFKKKPKTKLD